MGCSKMGEVLSLFKLQKKQTLIENNKWLLHFLQNEMANMYFTADLAHLSPTVPAITHLWEANARSRNQADVCLLVTPRAMPVWNII